MIFCINNIMFGFFNSKVSEEKQEEDRQKKQEEDRKKKRRQDIYDILNEKFEIRKRIYDVFFDIENDKIQNYIVNKKKEDENYDTVSDYELINMKILHNLKKKGVVELLEKYWEEISAEYLYDWCWYQYVSLSN